ncbi:DHH family phosphoesterase [Desulfolucanica intricata]|uniref:DHH family phosphoesterase n=1 Tax=Desulfolucanica intricata TaxID=1285191 RepID=UPI00082C96D1|nr:bifunctional oligoribonuclease/PAP phosphatase NrnA [Desulfolucanica intricata]
MNSLGEIANVIRRARRFFLCGHVTPDGDSIGSVLALGLALESLGKEVILASPEPVPESLSFLPSAKRIRINFNKAPDFEIFIMLDCSEVDRLGAKISEVAKLAQQKIILDHHPTSGCTADYCYIDDTAAATGEIVYDLLEILDIEFTPEIATCLYTAIVTDTGSFQYQNTTPKTHLRASRLLSSGVDVARVSTSLFGEKPLAHIRIVGVGLKNLKLSPCGQVAWISITREMLADLKVQDEYSEGLINYPRMIKGVEVALLFRELEPELFKVSLRSKSEIDVNAIAKVFGGGGHVRASGCRLEGKLAEVERQVLEEVYRALRGNED